VLAAIYETQMMTSPGRAPTEPSKEALGIARKIYDKWLGSRLLYALMVDDIALALDRFRAASVREAEGEREARYKLAATLREKDKAMGVLFDRLVAAGVDCSDLIP
jgi:hypothetical protein